MPAPTTADELLDLLQKSNLIEEPRLRAYLDKLRETSTLPTDPSKLAQFLVRDAVLTYFQAEQLLQGKYKRFSLGKYKVLERLGSGGMGTVFLCEHKLMRRRVAVKVLPVTKVQDRASLDRFYREARAVAAVDHPNIVRAYDIDQDDNLHFLVMEWVDGTNLQDLVKKFGPVDAVRACHYIYGSSVGLQHAHEIGLIHRDIKPGNILIDRSGVVKILDLGLARLTHDQDDQLTRQNDENVLGTADYLAPEQALDSHTVDIRADIYSLGATFYFLLSGSPPFPEGSVAQKLIWHQNRPPRPLKSLRAEVPDEVVAIVEKMMAKDAAKRYQTPSEVMAALSTWVAMPIAPPNEREMPTLSPAVLGGMAAGRGPSLPLTGPPSLVGGGMRTLPVGASTFTGMPTAVASATVATPPPATTPAPQPAPANVPAVWSNLDMDTQSVARGDTEKPGPAEESPNENEEEERPSRVNRRTPAKDRGKGKLLIFAVLGAVVLAGGAVGAYFVFFKKRAETLVTPGTTSHSHKITVSKAGGEHTVGTLREALIKANAGDTIVIAEPKLVEPMLRLDKNKHKDLTIESGTPDGKPAVIEFLGNKGGVMFDVPSVEGFHLRNVEFDGKGQAERGIQVSGISSGTTFEHVTIRGVQKTGFYLWNLAGDAAKPVMLDHVRVLMLPTSEAGIVSLASGGLDNKFITIKNSRVEGSGNNAGFGIRVDGPTLDLEISNNRLFNLNAAISFVRPSGKTSRGNVTSNTIFRANVGLHFESPVNEGRYEFKVEQNYFAQTGALLNTNGGPVQGLVSENNLHDPACTLGNAPFTATKLDTPTLPNPNPDDDATFLRFPANTAPTTGPNKARVGAQ